MKAKLVAAIGILLLSSASAAEDFFTVFIDLARDGHVFASPKIVTAEGSSAFVYVGGSNRINLAFVVYARPNRRVEFMAAIDTLRDRATPEFVAIEEQPFEFQLNDIRARVIVYRNKI